MTEAEFAECIKTAAAKIKDVSREDTIKVVSHLDADGICSSAVLLKALFREGFRVHLSTVRQLTEDVLLTLSQEDYNIFIFSDLGSGQYILIRKYLESKIVFILDHHEFDLSLLEDKPDGFFIVNPHRFLADGADLISGSGVVYLVMEELNPKNKELSHLAIVGAIGDMLENNGFYGFTNKILETAIDQGLIKVEYGPRWFGIETRPLYKLLMYSTDPYIPGITGNESATIQFLNEIGIEPKNNDQWKTYHELTEEEHNRLISAVIMKRKNEDKPEDILGKRYILLKEAQASPMHDAREFSTLLNACGRMSNSSYGIGACLNDQKSKKAAIDTLISYRKELISALGWFEQNKNSGNIINTKDYLIINAEDSIMPTMIGTVASIISKSDEFDQGKYIISMAHDGNDTKVSLRFSGNNPGIDLREIAQKIIEICGGESGGHKNAAGAVIPKENEMDFIKAAQEVLSNS
jgi:single-stranded-DNA-specific exonuclease